MWCPPGYTTLTEIAERLFHEAWDHLLDCSEAFDDCQSVETETDSTINWQPWMVGNEWEVASAYRMWMLQMFLDIFERHVLACPKSGTLLKLSGNPFQWAYLQDDNYDDELATEGPEFPDRKHLIERINERRFVYLDGHYFMLSDGVRLQGCGESPYEILGGAALCVAAELLPSAASSLGSFILASYREADLQGAQPAAIRNLPERVAEGFRSGRFITKLEAKAIYGARLPTEAWRQVWREARVIEPRISKPGPRPQSVIRTDNSE